MARSSWDFAPSSMSIIGNSLGAQSPTTFKKPLAWSAIGRGGGRSFPVFFDFLRTVSM